jgi:F-type H+-transporting ATPase subunit b
MHQKTLGVLMLMAFLFLVLHPAMALGAEETIPLLERHVDLMLWTIVIFVLLFLVLRFVKLPGASAPAWVMMLQGLHNRERSINQAIEDARKAREDAESLKAQHKSELEKAKDEVRAIIDEGRRNAQQVADDLMAKAKNEAQAERDRLRREMDTARSQALRDLTGWAAQLATMISTKALGRQMNADDNRRLVDEALGDMEKADSAKQLTTTA